MANAMALAFFVASEQILSEPPITYVAPIDGNIDWHLVHIGRASRPSEASCTSYRPACRRARQELVAVELHSASGVALALGGSQGTTETVCTRGCQDQASSRPDPRNTADCLARTHMQVGSVPAPRNFGPTRDFAGRAPAPGT